MVEEVRSILESAIDVGRARELLIELVKVPSPQTDRFEAEPLARRVHPERRRAPAARGRDIQYPL